jgi:beta-N-acetylhexosaminidase
MTAARVQPLGPVMVDVAGLELQAAEREVLAHPAVGAVILFARNYASPEQLAALCDAIHAVRSPTLPIAVDHEGGRVQRFRDGFTHLPPMAALGQLHDRDPDAACAAARDVGVVLASELRACGVDFSFAPVLDLDHGRSAVIGHRAFHADGATVARLAGALIEGLGDAGMASVGKHFPGHGWAEADSHHALPEDARTLAAIEAADLVPFARLASRLDGVMPAHLVYPAIDPDPAGFSRFWLQDVLRTRIGFAGTIFSDDLTMAGAHGAGDIVARAHAAFDAGCDMVLVCNAPQQAQALVDALPTARVAAFGAQATRFAQAFGARPGLRPAPVDVAVTRDRVVMLAREATRAA